MNNPDLKVNICTCRIATCEKCKYKQIPVHKMNDSRRYCGRCGFNMGIKTCKFEEKK